MAPALRNSASSIATGSCNTTDVYDWNFSPTMHDGADGFDFAAPVINTALGPFHPNSEFRPTNSGLHLWENDGFEFSAVTENYTSSVEQAFDGEINTPNTAISGSHTPGDIMATESHAGNKNRLHTESGGEGYTPLSRSGEFYPVNAKKKGYRSVNAWSHETGTGAGTDLHNNEEHIDHTEGSLCSQVHIEERNLGLPTSPNIGFAPIETSGTDISLSARLLVGASSAGDAYGHAYQRTSNQSSQTSERQSTVAIEIQPTLQRPPRRAQGRNLTVPVKCPIQNCLRNRGENIQHFTRTDNLVQHLRKVHELVIPRRVRIRKWVACKKNSQALKEAEDRALASTLD